MPRSESNPTTRPAAALTWGLLALVPVMSACRQVQSAFEPRGPQAERLHQLWEVMLYGGTVIFVLVLAAVAGALLARKSQTFHSPEAQKRRWQVVGVATGLTVATLIALLVYNVLISRAITEPPKDPLRIRVVAHQWWWDITYESESPHLTVRTANELHIPLGRPVAITLESRDVIHSFWVPNLHGKMDAIPGRSNTLWLQADRAGVYRGQCAEFCGLQHAKMAFHVVATPPPEFAKWLEGQRAPGVAPTDPLEQRGQSVFLQKSCAMCHAIRGTPAHATAGPDLTHLASRRAIAAGSLPNRRGQLGGWILDPQHVKPGAKMPPVPIEGEELQALLRYLESLK